MLGIIDSAIMDDTGKFHNIPEHKIRRMDGIQNPFTLTLYRTTKLNTNPNSKYLQTTKQM